MGSFSWLNVGIVKFTNGVHSKNGKTCRLKFEWESKSKPYLMSVYDLFNEWVISLPHKKERLDSKGKIVTNWGLPQTISHKAFMNDFL